MVIDFEHHYIPAELGHRFGLDPNKKEPVKTRDATVHAQLFDLEAQIQDMNRVGIDVAVQSCILGWDTTLENCQLINECSARAQKDYPGRFVGLAHVPPLEGTVALKELERAKKRLEARLQALAADHKKDNTLTFEELGVDRVFVDEAQFLGEEQVWQLARVADRGPRNALIDLSIPVARRLDHNGKEPVLVVPLPEPFEAAAREAARYGR